MTLTTLISLCRFWLCMTCARNANRLKTFWKRSLRIVFRSLSAITICLYLFGLNAPYSKAVVPQQGWYIHSEVTWSGKDYWVIDNNTTSANGWLFDVSSSQINTTAFDYNLAVPKDVLPAYDYVQANQYWGGMSDYDWYIDSDWIIKVYFASGETGVDAATAVPNSNCYHDYSTTKLKLLMWDETTMPSLVRDVGSYNEGSRVHNGFELNSNRLLLHDSRYSVLPTIDLTSDLEKVMYFSPGEIYPIAWQLGYVQITNAQRFLPINPPNISINDLRFCVVPNGAWINPGNSGNVYAKARMSVQFMCPKDKAPAGLSVGDRWPKVRPVEVEIENAYEAYYNNLLSNGQIKNPGDVNKVFGDLNGKLNDATKVPTIDSDLNTNALSNMMGVLGPLTQMLPWLLAGLFVIVLIRRAVA